MLAQTPAFLEPAPFRTQSARVGAVAPGALLTTTPSGRDSPTELSSGLCPFLQGALASRTRGLVSKVSWVLESKC